jgi:hypothetical protein
LLLFEALTREVPVRLSKFPVIARAIACFEPLGRVFTWLILSETWRRIRRDLWTFFKISLLAGNSAFIEDQFLDALRRRIRATGFVAPNHGFGSGFFGYFSSSAIIGAHASGSSWSASWAKRFL